MKWLGPILLIGVFLRHDTSQWLPGYSPPEWFYILGGAWEVILCATLLAIIGGYPLAIAALWIGILEGAQVGVCGAMMGHQRAPTGTNECDFLTGWPIGFLMTFAELGIVAGAIALSWPSARRS